MDKKIYDHDCESFADAIESMSGILGLPSKEAVAANLNAFKDTLDAEDSPTWHFEAIAHGAFKEAYHPIGFKGKFVIKFATEDNETSDEWYIYDESAHYGVQDFFLPSVYRRLQSCCLPANLIGDSDSYRYCDRETYWTDSQGVRRMTYTQTTNKDWRPSVFNFICTQPFATPACDIGWDGLMPRVFTYRMSSDEVVTTRELEYYKNPLTCGDRIIPWSLAEELAYDIDDRKWWQLALDTYGIDKCLALHAFIEEYGVHDLHTANYGYMIKDGKELPIIMDWLSG